MRRLTWCLILFSGCARLNTEVNIYDARCLTDPTATESALNVAVARILANEAQNQYSKAKSSLAPEIESLVKNLAAGHYIEQKEQEKTAKHLQTTYSDAVEKARAKHREAVDDFLESKRVNAPKAKLAELASARSNVIEGDQLLDRVVLELVQQIELVGAGNGSAPDDAAPKLLQNIKGFEKKADRTSRAIAAGYSILDDALASHVIYSEPTCWKGVYNQTYGRGVFGNTDIAIKMESAGDYTLKGLRLDTTKVTQAFFKTMSQAIQLTAAAYGVPVPGKSVSPQEGVAIDDEIIQADQKKLDSESARRMSRRSSLALMEVIVSQDSALQDGNKWKDAVEHIKKTMEMYKPTLLIND